MKHLLWPGLQFRGLLLPWWAVWQQEGRHGAGKVVDFYIQISRQQKGWVTVAFIGASEPSTSLLFEVTHFFQQGRSSTTYSNISPPIIPLPMSVWGPFSFKPTYLMRIVKFEHMYMSLGPAIGSWKYYQWSYLQ